MIADPVTRIVKYLGYDHKNQHLLLYFCSLFFFFYFQLLEEAKENFFLYKCVHFTFRNPDVQIIQLLIT